VIKIFKIILLLCPLLFFCRTSFPQELDEAKLDFYKSSKEFVNEINSIVEGQKNLKKMEIQEEFEGNAENIEILEESNRKQSIKSFEKYLKEYPNSDYVPDVLYRLGKLYFEEAAQKMIKDAESYEKEYQKFLRGEAQVLPPETNIDYSAVEKVLIQLVDKYKDYRFRDDALYILGYSYFEEGQMEKAVYYFQKVINEFPNSSKLPEIYTRLGENSFDSNQFNKAIYYYSRALEYPDSVYYENVLYKLGWIYYSRGQINEASDFFVTLIDNNEKKHGANYASTFNTEAKNYIAVGFSESKNGVKDAYTFFRNIGGRHYEYEIMSKICELYIMADKTKDVKASINFVLLKYPYEPENPVLQDKLINDLKKYAKYSNTSEELDKMIKLFGEGSVWREKNKDNSNAIITADSLIVKQIISAALLHQEKGDRTGNRSEYIAAAKLYYDFLKRRTGDPLVIGVRYNYAQVLFSLGNYVGALNEYMAVQQNSTEEQYREKSSFGVVISWQAKVKATDPKYHTKGLKPMLDSKGNLSPANQLSSDENSFILAIKKYENINSSSKRIDEVWYMESEVYFRNNMFDEAIVGYKNIIDKYPNSKFYTDAVGNLIALYDYRKDYKEVQYWSNKLLLSKNISSSSYSPKEIKSLITVAAFKSAQKLESEGKNIEAADEYARLARQYPKSEYSDAALYNAGVTYEKLGMNKEATLAYGTILSKYPKSKQTVDTMFRLAVSYEQNLDFDKAVLSYEAITKKYPNSKFTPDCYYNAYRIRRSKYEYMKAASNLLAYSYTRKNPKERASATMQAGWLYEQSDKDEKALNVYSSYIANNKTDLDGVMESYIRKGKIFEKMEKYNLAYDSYKSATLAFNASGKPSKGTAYNLNAEARFRVLGKTFYEYSSVKVEKYDNAKVKLSYDKKEKMLKSLTDQYLVIVELGVTEWSLASLYMIGVSFEKFADFLYAIPYPKEINTEELKKEYSDQIKTQVLPFENKAVEYYEKTISESSRLKTVNIWTKYSQGRLSKFSEDKNTKQSEELYVNSPSMDIVDYGFVGQ